MNIHILGTKGEIQPTLPYHAKKSGILIDDVLLVDLGEKSFLERNPKWVLITHLHPDHAYFVRRGHFEIPETKARVFSPQALEPKVESLRKKTQLGPYQVTPIPTIHSLYVQSQAYLIQKKGVSILYTGDLIWIKKKYRKLFHDIDLVITEASFIREGGIIRRDRKTGVLYGHTGVPNLIRQFSPYTDVILFTHFGSWFFQNTKAARKKLSILGEKYDTEVIVGYDGMRLRI